MTKGSIYFHTYSTYFLFSFFSIVDNGKLSGSAIGKQLTTDGKNLLKWKFTGEWLEGEWGAGAWGGAGVLTDQKGVNHYYPRENA